MKKRRKGRLGSTVDLLVWPSSTGEKEEGGGRRFEKKKLLPPGREGEERPTENEARMRGEEDEIT